MNTLQIKLSAAVAGVLLCASGLSSAQTEFDTLNSRFGARSLVLDTRTDTTWLNLNQTFGLSYDFIASNLGSGQRFDGFRIASQGEVAELFRSAGFDIQGMTPQPPTRQRLAAGADFAASFAGIAMGAGVERFWGQTSGQYSVYQQAIAGVTYSRGTIASAFDDGFYSIYNLSAYPNVGTWMIAAIPEPSVYAMLLLGLAATALAVGRRRRGPEA